MSAPPTTVHSRRWWQSQYSRAALFLALGCASLLGAVLTLSSTVARESTDRLLDERMALAKTAGAFLEQSITADLERAVRQLRPVASAADDTVARDALRRERQGMLLDAGLFLIATDGTVRASAAPGNVTSLREFAVDDLMATGRIAASRLVTVGGSPEILLVAPIRTASAGVVGYLGVWLEPSTTNLLASLDYLASDRQTTVELIDRDGTVVASSDRHALFRLADHGAELATAMTDGREVRGQCHSCHQERAQPVRTTEVLAFAPLPSLELGLVVRQPEELALAPAEALRRQINSLALAFVALFLIFAGLSVHSVVRPVKRLTKAVHQAESGKAPLEAGPYGRDEVGELAAALEQWRARMLQSVAAAERQRHARTFQRRYLQRTLRAQEEERRRVARDLHDTLAQDLAALRLEIERLSAHPDATGVVRDRLMALEGMGGEILQTVRRILLDLRLAELERVGFLPAVESQLGRLGRDLPLRVVFEHDGDERRLSYEVAVTLMRILQESLQNVVQHAQADHVFVSIAYASDAVTMTVEDDGVGFEQPVNPAMDGNGLGLLGMRERAELVGGQLRLDSKPGEGTTVSVIVPLSELDTPKEAQ